MGENVLRLEQPKKREIKFSASVRLPWPRIKKIIAVKNLLFEGWLESNAENCWIKGRIHQEIAYLDWRNAVRIFCPVLSFQEAEREEWIKEENSRQLEFTLHKHTYRLRQNSWIIGCSSLQQEFNLELNRRTQLDFLDLNPDFGMQRITARLLSRLEQKEDSWLKNGRFSLSAPAKEINAIDLKTELLGQETAGNLISCSTKNIFDFYYLGIDGKEHYAQFEKNLSVQLVMNQAHSLSRLNLKPQLELINYRLSPSGYVLILDYLLTIRAEQCKSEIRDVLVAKGKVLPGIDYVSIPALLSSVRGTGKKEMVFDCTFRMAGWVVNVIKLGGRIEIKDCRFKNETVVFEGMAIFDVYALDKVGRQHLIQEEDDFSLMLQFTEGNLEEHRFEQESSLTILGFSFEPYRALLTIHSLIAVDAELIKVQRYNLVTDIIAPDIKMAKKPFLIEEVIYSENYQISFRGETRLINPAKRLLDSRVRVIRLGHERKEDSVLISGSVEQELSFVSLDNVIHVQKDTLPFTSQLKLASADGDITIKADDIRVLPQLSEEGNKAAVDYLLILNNLVTRKKLCDLPVSLGVNNQLNLNLNGSEEIISFSFPVVFQTEKPKDVKAYLREVGISYGINQTYIGGKLVLLFSSDSPEGQYEEEIGFLNPINQRWKNDGYSFFSAVVNKTDLHTDDNGKSTVTVVLKLVYP